MDESQYIPLDIPPGVVKTDSDAASRGRWVDSDKVRFVNGRPEKIKGWGKLISDQAAGIARGAHAWTDSSGAQNIGFGTQCKLYTISGGDQLSNITPARASGSLTNPFTTTSGSPVVSVNHVGHGFTSAGDYLTFDSASAVGGITPDGEYTVTAVTDVDNYTITHSSNATSTVVGGGGSPNYVYEIACGNEDALLGLGYGAGRYGKGTYGDARSSSSAVFVEPRWWSLDNYGSDMLAVHNGGTLYQWDYSSMLRATAVSNAPSDIRFMFVTGERFPFLLREGMVVSWPDQDDITDHTPSATNTANTRTLQGGSKLMAGAALTDGISIVWSETTAFQFQYTGSALVYASRDLGQNTGLIGPHAYVAVDDRAFWMSNHDFHIYSGGISAVPNVEDMRDWVFENINRDQAIKVCCGFNARFREVWWIWPSGANEEPDKYVAVNIDTFEWVSGTMDRTAITRWRSQDGNPIMIGSDGYIYEHEKGDTMDDDGSPMEAYIQTGLFELMEGNINSDIMAFIPDTKRQTGDMTFYAFSREYPRSSDLETQTETVAATDTQTDLRLSGREFGFKLTSNTASGDFRLGRPKLEVQGTSDKR